MTTSRRNSRARSANEFTCSVTLLQLSSSLSAGARAVKMAGAGRVDERDRAGDDPRDAHDEATPPSTIRRRARTDRGHRRGRRGLGSGSPRLPAG